MGKRGQVRLTLLAGLFGLGSALAVEAAECRADQVMLRGDWGQARFSVELADDAEERAEGLMHRDSLPQSAGMLFIYPNEKRVGFWMKNTLIPLDMIFLDATGTVIKVHHMARPHDETPIMGGNNVRAVLEINGGLARRLGLVAGSQLRHPAFTPDRAAWPC